MPLIGFEVIVPREVRPLVDQLSGKRAGYRRIYSELERDPCSETLGAYRLSGPLEPVVCGVHLDRGWRLGFTMRQPIVDGDPIEVIVIFVGKRLPNHGPGDVWEILHDLFGVENPPDGHLKPPCCAKGFPDVSDEALSDFKKQLRRFAKG